MKKNIYMVIFASVFLWNCSAIQESESSKSDGSQDVYVFDDINSEDSSNIATEKLPEPTKNEIAKLEEPTNTNNSIIELYIIQVGAFTTKEKAESFLSNIKDKTDYELNIHFSDSVGLHVIQLPPFRTREEAEKVRNELRTIKELEGTFIVPNNQTNLK